MHSLPRQQAEEVDCEDLDFSLLLPTLTKLVRGATCQHNGQELQGIGRGTQAVQPGSLRLSCMLRAEELYAARRMAIKI